MIHAHTSTLVSSAAGVCLVKHLHAFHTRGLRHHCVLV